MSAGQARLQSLPSAADGKRGAVRAYVSAHYGRVLFVVVFVLPTLLAAIYFGLVASDRYISEARFLVRSADKPASQGAAAYLQDFGIMRANDDAFAIADYIHSRDVMHAIEKVVDVRAVYSRPGADMFSRFGGSSARPKTDEALFRYFIRQVAVEKDSESGITAVKVSAYRPEDAKALLDRIIGLSELRVNELNARARRDSLADSERALNDAVRRLAQATVDLARYRESAGTVDPQQSAGATVERSSSLQQELAQLQVSLQTMLARAPGNPSIPALRQRIAALSGQVAAQQEQLTGDRDSLSGKLGGYEQQLVEQELAEKAYEAAQKQFDAARSEADRQQVFIELIARPNLSDEPQEPRRLRYMLTAALLSFWAFLIFYLLLSGSREHLNMS
jgi:capsular polysaccharide transport system permease protein